MNIRDRIKTARDRWQESRALKQARRPLDENDREALDFLRDTIEEARKDGDLSIEEGLLILDALAAWVVARKDTPVNDLRGLAEREQG